MPTAKQITAGVVVAAALLVTMLLLGTFAWADSGTQAGELTTAAPAPDEQAHTAGTVTLVALAGVVLFGVRRISRVRHRRA